ncbi:hypothetical protein V103_02698 [Staphylococcus aureus 22(2K81-5)]|nr:MULTISPECIES: hypothetical protein [Staphylococcus]EZT74161.1 hypothetical protein V103_02698 [Staphylococcus aureus 22(2K81-5)]EZV76797.1 hypothetical protein V084_02627 [Staphylococcus aureus 2011-60-1490-31]EZV84165.1 hypothetical protein V081_02686 [Staphylococcus aureus 2011-60-2275-1]EZW90201.1 hypothetical protein U952_02594 [Staphylococcus aureus 87807-12]EZZ99509.1 hypothetical protein W399_02704 [Staphylococcus aureus VET0061R]KAA19374.1 hypothetical protein W405_02688 [Staphyloc
MHTNHTKYIFENQGNETLKDVSKSGKERPWKDKKIDNVSYADILEVLKLKKAHNVRDCGNILGSVAKLKNEKGLGYRVLTPFHFVLNYQIVDAISFF